MGEQIREFQIKTLSVMSNMDPDFMATRYCGLDRSEFFKKYLSASQEKVSYTPVNFAAENLDAFMTIFDTNR